MTRALLVVVALLTAALQPAAPAQPARKKPQELHAFMEHHLNPAFSELSFQLFHGAKTEDEKLFTALKGLRDQSRQLLRELPDDAQPELRASAVQLLSAAEGITLAAANGASRGNLEHWFEHVSASCVTCHSQFKDAP